MKHINVRYLKNKPKSISSPFKNNTNFILKINDYFFNLSSDQL